LRFRIQDCGGEVFLLKAQQAENDIQGAELFTAEKIFVGMK
jgi:hypothetical protein